MANKPKGQKKEIKKKPIARKVRGAKKFRYTASDGKKYILTEQQKKFCEKYCEFGASGVDAIYAAGYKPKNARVAAAMASKELVKVNIFSYIETLYDEYGFTDENVTKQHLFLINQDGDLTNKAKGLDMYFKRKGLYPPKGIDLTSGGEKLPVPIQVINTDVHTDYGDDEDKQSETED